jgi:hypothetical protein
MDARRHINSASLGPVALNAIGQAFDDAWEELASSVSGRPSAIEAAKLRLANIVLSLATEAARDPIALKNEAVRRFKLTRQIAS